MRNIIKVDDSFIFDNLSGFRSLLLQKQLLPLTQDLNRIQVLFNYLKKGVCILPHQHSIVPKDEVILIIYGRIVVGIFNENSELVEEIYLSKQENLLTVIPAGTYHSVEVLSDEAILLQIINGPYDSATHKEFIN